MDNYRLGLVSVSFRNNTPDEILQQMKIAGLSCIEWGSDVHAPYNDISKLKQIVKMQQEYGITCCSFGTYFKIGTTPIDELYQYIDAAKILGTNILRLWCGNKDSEKYSKEEKEQLFAQCKQIAVIAESNNVTLCMECHNDTYTNTKESALELMHAVNSHNFKMYWQPNQFRSVQENLDYAQLLSNYTEHIHVFNWEQHNRYPLQEGTDIWKNYLKKFKGTRSLLLEFMPDNKIESLEQEAKALFTIGEE